MIRTARMEIGEIHAMARTIVERFQPRRIILFGSYARGAASAESDVDLFVEMDTPLHPPERAIAVSAVFGLRHWPLDVVVYTPEEVRQLHNVRGTLLSIIEAEGVVLYEQS